MERKDKDKQSVEAYQVRTDLALEARESFSGTNREIKGVILEKERDEKRDVSVTRVVIKNKAGEKAMRKPIGTYITLEAKNLQYPDNNYHREVSVVLAKYIKELMPDISHLSVLVVGLGNQEVTPDALGPLAVDNLCITRHITKEYGKDVWGEKGKVVVSSLTPGVMAKTGMETAEIVKGVVDETKPDVVIVIDSLAARSTKRLNTTIQITNTGIAPGSGVGNHRNSISSESMGVPVIAVGVPTVVEAATIVVDTMENLVSALGEMEEIKPLKKVLKQFHDYERHELMRELLEPELGIMYVTPKDVDETIRQLSYTISEGLNLAFAG